MSKYTDSLVRYFTRTTPNEGRSRVNLRQDLAPVVWTAIVILILWEMLALLDVVVAGRDVSKYFYAQRTRIPFPHLLIGELVTVFPFLAREAFVTFQSTLAGFLVGLTIGVLFSILMWRYPLFETTFYPYAVASQMMPIIAIAPIISYIIPSAPMARVLTASYLTFFPVMVNCVRGLKSTNPLAIELFETYGASVSQKFRKLHFPSALPYLFAGMKLGSTQSVLAAIVVEFMGARDGIGVVILRASYYGAENAYRLWSAVVFAGLLAAVLYVAVTIAERTLTSWQPELRSGGSETQE